MFLWIELGLNTLFLCLAIVAFIVLIKKYVGLEEKPPHLLFYPGFILFVITILCYVLLIILVIMKIIDIFSYKTYINDVINCFIVLYSMQNYSLILSLYTRLYCIFKSTFVELTQCLNCIFIIILSITPFIFVLYTITIYHTHSHPLLSNKNKNNQYVSISIIVIIQFYIISLLIILVTLFLYKLHQIYRDLDNELLLQITTRYSILATITVIFSIISCIVIIFSSIHKYNNNYFQHFQNITIAVNIFTNFLYITLSLEIDFFHASYQHLCGFTDKLCRSMMIKWLQIDPPPPSPTDDSKIPRPLSESIKVIKQNSIRDRAKMQQRTNSVAATLADFPKIIELPQLPKLQPQQPGLQKVSSNSFQRVGHKSCDSETIVSGHDTPIFTMMVSNDNTTVILEELEEAVTGSTATNTPITATNTSSSSRPGSIVRVNTATLSTPNPYVPHTPNTPTPNTPHTPHTPQASNTPYDNFMSIIPDDAQES